MVLNMVQIKVVKVISIDNYNENIKVIYEVIIYSLNQVKY